MNVINRNGTPKTLIEAIQNAVAQFYDPRAVPNSIELNLDKMIELHVVDFLAQKVSVLLVTAGDKENEDKIQTFWAKVKAQPKNVSGL